VSELSKRLQKVQAEQADFRTAKALERLADAFEKIASAFERIADQEVARAKPKPRG